MNLKWLTFLTVSAGLLLTAGCGGGTPQKQNREFFTSGSREADQRASQRMAKDEQLTGSGEGTGEKGAKKATKAASGDELTPTGTTNRVGTTNRAAQVAGKLALFDRLGGDAGISNIVADFMPRAIQDPRVNWERNGMKRGGLSIHRDQSIAWKPSPQNVELLQKHLV